MQQIAPMALAAWLERDSSTSLPPVLLDVREPSEWAICHVAGSLHIPMQEIPLRWQELPEEQDVVVICHHGVRSMHVAMYLEHVGLQRIYNLQGGIDAWAHAVDPSMARY